MTTYVFPPIDVPSLPVEGDRRRFPVRRIFCVGKNYADHTREMGGDPRKDPPFFFSKPADALVQSGAEIPYPSATESLHYEAELVVAIGAHGHKLTPEQARSVIWGYAAGNDLTRRDIQSEAKKLGRPWDMAKGFDNSAVVGRLRPGPLEDGMLRCTVGGVQKQQALLSDMIWPVDHIIARLSSLVELAPGDLIFTGTPAGVGRLEPGETCVVEVDGLPAASVTLTSCLVPASFGSDLR